MQMAIQQCLMEDGSDADQVTLWEALRTQQPDTDLQRFVGFFFDFLFDLRMYFCRALQYLISVEIT